jgi:hypothetical protein
LERFWPNCGPSARRPGAGMQQPCAGAAARDAGAAARAPPSGTPAASGCAAFAGGVLRPPAARRFRARSHTDAQGGRRPATCMCAFRPLRARACAVFLRVMSRCYTRCVRWPGRTRSCCASECPWSVPVRPEWPCLSVCLLQSCVRACRAPAACRAMCFDGWCPNCRPREHSVVARRGLALQRGGSRRPHNRWYLPRQVVLYRCMFHCEQSGD